MKNRMFMATQSGLKIFERIKDFWEERDHALTGLDITAVDLNGDKGILGTTEGVYISKDGGENWLLDSKGIDTPHARWVRIHPHDPRYTFVGTEPANIYSKMEDDDQWQKSERVSQLRDQNDWFMPYSPNPGCVRGFAFHKQTFLHQWKWADCCFQMITAQPGIWFRGVQENLTKNPSLDKSIRMSILFKPIPPLRNTCLHQQGVVFLSARTGA